MMLFKALVFIGITTLCLRVTAQTGTSEEHINDERLPQAKIDIQKFLKDSLRYPTNALSLGVGGEVFVRFVVDTLGNVAQTRIAKGVKSDYGLNEEAIRLINSIPPGSYEPAMYKGKPVSCWISLAVSFNPYPIKKVKSRRSKNNN